MTELAEQRSLVEWSTKKVIERLQLIERVPLAVRRQYLEGKSDDRITNYLTARCQHESYLMANVFEPLTGVTFDAIDWRYVIDVLADRTKEKDAGSE